MERLAQEPLGRLGAVGVGGVEERHTELRGAAEKRTGGRGVGRVAPGAPSGQGHGAEPEARHVGAADPAHRKPVPWPCAGGGKSA